jgi:NTE family protein
LRTDFAFGNTYGIATEFYKRFTQTSPWFFAPRVSASNSAQWIYSNNDPQADYRIGLAEAGIDLGYALSRFSEVRVGYEIGYLNARLKLGTPQFASVNGRVNASRFLFTTDHRDNPIIPHQGFLGELTFHWVDTSPGAPTSFSKVSPSLLLSSWLLRVGRPWAMNRLAFLNTFSGGRPDYMLMARMKCAEISISSSKRDTCADCSPCHRSSQGASTASRSRRLERCITLQA